MRIENEDEQNQRQAEIDGVRRILHETLAKNAKAHHEIEDVKNDLVNVGNGEANERMRKELEAIRERLARIKTLIEPPVSDRPDKTDDRKEQR